MSSLNRVVSMSAIVGLLIFAGACGAEDDPVENTNGNNQNSNNQNGDNTNGQNSDLDDWDPDFVEVADVVRMNCAVGDCHGVPADDDVEIRYGANQQDVSYSVIADNFQTFESSNDRPFVDPGNAEGSELYQVLISDDPDVRMPNVGDPLDADTIEMIRNWIDDGANYE